MTAYFKKEFPKTPIFLADGTKLQFEPRESIVGFYKTDSDATITALQKLQAEHRGGVFKIDAAEYEEGKKKAASNQSKLSWREEIGAGSAQDTMLKRAPQKPASAPAAPKPATAPAPAAEKVVRPAVKPPLAGKRSLG